MSKFCPSVEDDRFQFSTEPCSESACTWWKSGCTAAIDTISVFQEQADQEPMPNCPKQAGCRWHVDAIARGESGCIVRRLGMLCEHAGGDWNTFEMEIP